MCCCRKSSSPGKTLTIHLEMKRAPWPGVATAPLAGQEKWVLSECHFSNLFLASVQGWNRFLFFLSIPQQWFTSEASRNSQVSSRKKLPWEKEMFNKWPLKDTFQLKPFYGSMNTWLLKGFSSLCNSHNLLILTLSKVLDKDFQSHLPSPAFQYDSSVAQTLGRIRRGWDGYVLYLCHAKEFIGKALKYLSLLPTLIK